MSALKALLLRVDNFIKIFSIIRLYNRSLNKGNLFYLPLFTGSCAARAK